MSVAYPLKPDAVRFKTSSNILTFIRGFWAPDTASAAILNINSSIFNDLFSEYESYNVPNWDGGGAEPITAETLQAARNFHRTLPRGLPSPDIAPGADGTIGFEWREGPRGHRKYVIVEVGPGNRIVARKLNERGVPSRFHPIRADWDAIQHLLTMLFPLDNVSTG